MSDDGSFFARWSRRKSEQRQGIATPDEPAGVEPAPVSTRQSPGLDQAAEAGPPTDQQGAAVEPSPPPPTLADAEALAPGDEVSRFLAPDVDPGVKNAALKKLFADPHYNVMDGLDIYIDDYGKPDPIPPEMLRQLVQSKFLGLFDDEESDEEQPQAQAQAVPSPDIPSAAAPQAEATEGLLDNSPQHEDADLRLQPDDAAGPTGAGEGPRTRRG